MAILDKILFRVFLSLSLVGLSWAIFAFYKAFKTAERKDDPDGFRMFMWACGGLIGLIIAGVSFAYILLPIIFHYSFE